MSPTPPTVLVIAGSDPSGGAGLEADQRVLAMHGCYAVTATTALTVQNTLGVQDVLVTPPEFLRRQLEALLEDVQVDVVKVGMLASKESNEVVRDVLEKWKEREKGKGRSGYIVLDPVMISTSGYRWLPEDAEREMLKLLPLTTVLTPNVPEACLLNHHAPFPRISAEPLLDLGGMKQLAKGLQMLGPQAVLLKVGYVPLNPNHQNEVQDAGNEDPEVVIDIFYDGHEFTTREIWYSTSVNTHGAGCSLASALAANLALKKPLHAAVQDACQYVETATKTGFQLGHGNGPINHFHSLQVLPFVPGRFLDYLIRRPDVAPLWNDFTQHKFVRMVGDGSLPLEVFKRFLVQDYLYLTQFARTNALAAHKSNNMDDIAASAEIVLGVQKEMRLHLEYCQDLGISQQDLEASKESQATVSYSRYLLDIGHSGDWLGLQVAMASCLVGYQIAAEWVKSQPGSRSEGNRYWKWVENYGGEEYAEGVRVGRGMIERHASQLSPNRVEELVRIFIRVTELEVDFWEFDAHLR